MAKATFSATNKSIPQLLTWVHQQLALTPLGSTARGHLALAVEEAVVNVLTHGKTPHLSELSISIRELSGREVEVEVRDRAAPFNPLVAKIEIDTDLPLEERELGGLGIPFMHRLVDALFYRYEGGENILTLVKNCTKASA